MTKKLHRFPGHRFTRREALWLAGSTSATAYLPRALVMLASGLANETILRAQGQDAGVPLAEPRRHLYLEYFGAWPRWYFDLPLAPFGSDAEVVRNLQVATAFQDAGGVAGDPVYRSVPVTVAGVTVNMPSAWASEMPTVGGGTVPMHKLMENMCIVRGINMVNDGHVTNAIRLMRPNAAAPSMQGAIADRTADPLPAVGIGGAIALRGYRSRAGIGVSQVMSSDNYVRALLNPFDLKSDGLSDGFLSRRAAVAESVQLALDQLAAYASSSMPGSTALFAMRDRVEKQLAIDVEAGAQAYTTLKAKYEALVARALAMPTVGVTDKPIPPARYSDLMRRANDKNGAAVNADLRTIITPATSLINLVETFAVAEFLFTRNLARSVTGIIQMGGGMNIQGIPETTMPFDEHVIGVVPSLIRGAFVCRVTAACIYEFLEVMRSKGLHEETVVQMGAEFSRAPRNDGSGADHGFRANVTSLYCGAIRAPIIVGNVRSNPSPADVYLGSWGVAGKVAIEGSNVELGVGHAAATLAALLRVEAPLANNTSLIRDSDKGFVAAVENARTNDET